MSLNSQITEAIKPIATDLLAHNCLDCAIDQMMVVILQGFKEMTVEYRLRVFTALQTTFDIQTGESL